MDVGRVKSRDSVVNWRKIGEIATVDRDYLQFLFFYLSKRVNEINKYAETLADTYAMFQTHTFGYE